MAPYGPGAVTEGPARKQFSKVHNNNPGQGQLLMRGKTAQTARDKKWFHSTEYGNLFNGDSYHFISGLREDSVDLIVDKPALWTCTSKGIRERSCRRVPRLASPLRHAVSPHSQTIRQSGHRHRRRMEQGRTDAPSLSF